MENQEKARVLGDTKAKINIAYFQVKKFVAPFAIWQAHSKILFFTLNYKFVLFFVKKSSHAAKFFANWKNARVYRRAAVLYSAVHIPGGPMYIEPCT